MSILKNLNEIRENISKTCEKVNRNPNEIKIIGVTKYVTVERAQELIDSGVTDLGENRAEELIHKYDQLGSQANFHFIGTLQSRKVKDIIDKVSTIHSLDKLSVAKQINNRSNNVLDCFVQVNISEEESKHGLKIEEVYSFIEQLREYDKINVVGLMTMAPHITDELEIRAVFKELAKLRDTIRNKNIKNAPCEYLSMGMSNDYQIAIEEGATHIRIGSNLVGN
ncbi:MAG TPA: YggS family pyridoxal phosphate-dependent enzyme [Pseudogracilibacillus sp.]|nr:YggS family pyridoxal phosphate-dependent enzyme [Pseudogracilibacillus sp.]